MTYHNGRPDVIETDDITQLLAATISEEDGQKVATLKVALSDKVFGAGPDGLYFHVTNGVQPRMLGPVEPEIIEPVVEEVKEEIAPSPEASPELSESAKGESSKTADGTSDETVKTSSVKGKGN